MPARAFRQAKPGFYLDQSTLCDAFRAHVQGSGRPADRAFRSLMPWIERVAHEANLCLSIFHLLELARWGDRATADAMAKWYEDLPITFVRSLTDVQNEEADYWTELAGGGRPIPPKIFAPSLLTAFAEAPIQLLGQQNPLTGLVAAMRLQDDTRNAGLVIAQTFRDDRAWARAQGLDPAERQRVLDYNLRTGVRRIAAEAFERLSRRSSGPSVPATLDGIHIQDRLVSLYEQDPQCLPSFRLTQLFSKGIADLAVRKQPGSAGERDALSGSFPDVVHLAVGAAYCDIFTCDRETSHWIGGYRATLGYCPQIVFGGHIGGATGFVQQLMATWP